MENASLFPHLRTSQGGRQSRLARLAFSFFLDLITFGVQLDIGLQYGAEARARLYCLYRCPDSIT